MRSTRVAWRRVSYAFRSKSAGRRRKKVVSRTFTQRDSLSSSFQSGLELESVTVVGERRPREPPQPLEDEDEPGVVEAIGERQKQRRDGAHETLQGTLSWPTTHFISCL